MSEHVFVFPAVPRLEVVRLLDELAVAGHGSWSTNTRLIVWLTDEASGLYQGWEPEDIANLEQTVGRRPEWAVQINYRLSHRADLAALAVALIKGWRYCSR
ncbi:hypothetical protein [Salinispora arenicola]|uniref:hypothetical protein n=1 Tax=Salinispora arenicola TaxID=168697 RepID=UPI000363BA15|nr:hypothetical protein [Salinispora arenicola]MCN0150557.1 hypothetical protein [Salinispora arenicola]